jgi:hypothetical protein
LQTTSPPAYKPVTGRKLPDPAFTPSARDTGDRPLEPAARWRVTSGILHGAPSKKHLAGRQVYTPSTRDEPPARVCSAWERGTKRVGSAESRVAYSTPAARPTKTSLFSLSPPLPFNRGAPGQGVAASPAMHGGPCTARAMRVAHRYGRPWRARLGEGPVADSH